MITKKAYTYYGGRSVKELFYKNGKVFMLKTWSSKKLQVICSYEKQDINGIIINFKYKNVYL